MRPVEGAGGRIGAAAVSAHGDTFALGRTQPLFEVRAQRPRNVFEVTPEGPPSLPARAMEGILRARGLPSVAHGAREGWWRRRESNPITRDLLTG
jgi:hypothetical protein